MNNFEKIKAMDIENLPHYLDNDGKSIKLTVNTAKDIFAYMQAKFQRGDGKGHTDWFDGEMVALVPPEYIFYLGKFEEDETLCGWQIIRSNTLHIKDDEYYVLFQHNVLTKGAVKVKIEF